MQASEIDFRFPVARLSKGPVHERVCSATTIVCGERRVRRLVRSLCCRRQPAIPRMVDSTAPRSSASQSSLPERIDAPVETIAGYRFGVDTLGLARPGDVAGRLGRPFDVARSDCFPTISRGIESATEKARSPQARFLLANCPMASIVAILKVSVVVAMATASHSRCTNSAR